MDQEQFDQITRTLASGNSRRGLVRTLTGAALGGILVAVGVGEAGAKKQGGGRRDVAAQQGKPVRCPRGCRVGKGKNATCCTSGEFCCNNACRTDNRSVSLSFRPAPEPEGYCNAFVDVTGFCPNTTYVGSADRVGTSAFPNTTITVDGNGDGSGRVADGSPNLIWSPGEILVATVDGISSVNSTVSC